ncbi:MULTISPECIES: biotin transporter BioY [unclassified Ruminococcus]|uniref:biotin transporter BioY n=1 Tax=unclassified Ruminococcus TaxID=2608920 RepID=UPI0021094313|nr:MULTISPECIES: biotin transporter BioY [unclassified Ruminococcus]MCQ4021413.1 biotin transporter BioY [Ruminococcus sp. zg-924]MCQ4113858.1 biotin transporter BioY [Ruminococcus sp. zg-921]
MDTANTVKRSATYSIVLTALFAALTAVFSQIAIPIGPVPINLAMFSVFVAGGLLGIRRAMISQLVYVLLGAVGVPVFAGFKGGFAAIAGPTGGYIIGYILAAGTIALICRFWNKKIVALAVAMVVGLAVCYSFGTAWFVISTGSQLWYSLTICVFPFLPGDAAKIIAAVLLCSRLKKIV